MIQRWLKLGVFFLLLISLSAAMGGCAVFGFMAAVVDGGQTVPAEHTLKEERTAIVVDDPQQALKHPGLTDRIVSHVRFHLKENSNLKEKHLVSMEAFDTVRDRLGDDYFATPLAEIGRQLDAAQVVHVAIREAQLRRNGSLYRPSASAEVKVIGIETGQRRFPTSEQTGVGSIGPDGRVLKVELDPRHLERSRRSNSVLLRRELAQRIGRDAARLFYRHNDSE